MKHILFIQGGGNEGYEADAKLAASLQQALGATYEVRYPRLSEDALPDFGWPEQIGNEFSLINSEVILVGHSLGASMLLKYLSEHEVPDGKIKGIFLISTPFWEGTEDWVQGLKLQEDFADNIPKDIPVFLYHSRDDEEVPFAHLAHYAQKLPQATLHESARGGHQFNNDLTGVARDIRAL